MNNDHMDEINKVRGPGYIPFEKDMNNDQPKPSVPKGNFSKEFMSALNQMGGTPYTCELCHEGCTYPICLKCRDKVRNLEQENSSLKARFEKFEVCRNSVVLASLEFPNVGAYIKQLEAQLQEEREKVKWFEDNKVPREPLESKLLASESARIKAEAQAHEMTDVLRMFQDRMHYCDKLDGNEIARNRIHKVLYSSGTATARKLEAAQGMANALVKTVKVLETFYHIEDGEKSYMVPIGNLFRITLPEALTAYKAATEGGV